MIGQTLNWIDSFWPSADVMHVLLFALLGLTVRIAFPALPLRILIAGLALFAGASEVVQL
ncbi:MAG: hypothetical protein Q9M08_00255 [Mariprofundus sp.]|nr:hypothetical protein [Mariprofundus sp.]